MLIKSEMLYFAAGSIVADSRDRASGLMVIASGRIGIQLPMDSKEADEEHSCFPENYNQEQDVKSKDSHRLLPGASHLHVLKRGSVSCTLA